MTNLCLFVPQIIYKKEKTQKKTVFQTKQKITKPLSANIEEAVKIQAATLMSNMCHKQTWHITAI